MYCMTQQLDKLFIGYDENDLHESDGGRPKALVAITRTGAMEAYADGAYIATGLPLHWEVCYDTINTDRVLALLETRRLAFSLGMVAMHGVASPAVVGDITVISGKPDANAASGIQ